jgi:predicted GNAT family acetyltransferase
MVNNSLINKYPKVALDIAESPKAAMILLPKEKTFEITKSDASNIFGQGAERVKYIDSQSKGTIEILVKPNGTASVLGLEVPEKFRGLGIGQSLQAKAMQDFAEMQGQVSSKAAATTAYRLGRRPPFQPNATLKDVYNLIDENSSVNLVSPKMQTRFQQEQ